MDLGHGGFIKTKEQSGTLKCGGKSILELKNEKDTRIVCRTGLYTKGITTSQRWSLPLTNSAKTITTLSHS